MKVKIISADSKNSQRFIGIIGDLTQLEKYGIIIDKGEGSDKRYLQTSPVEKIIIKTKNTTYEMEVI